jgi:filamin
MFSFSSGRYAVDVKYGDKPVADSPFRVRAGPPYDASKVKVSGPGVEKTGIVAEEVTKALVDTTEAGIADLSGLLNMIT